MHGPARNAAPPAGPRYNRHLAEQPRPAAAVDPFASGSDGTPSIYDDEYGPEVVASFGSTCDSYACTRGGDIFEGDVIRADGEGGWVHSECAAEDSRG